MTKANEINKVSEAEIDVCVWITHLYAGTDLLKGGHLADEKLIKYLFPSFDGDWEALSKQIGTRIIVNGEEYYACERLDWRWMYSELPVNTFWLRKTYDDEAIVF